MRRYVTVTLRMHQMEYLHKRKLPTDLGEGLVFSRTQLARLHARIDELVAGTYTREYRMTNTRFIRYSCVLTPPDTTNTRYSFALTPPIVTNIRNLPALTYRQYE